jgi:hypothetical protein
LCVYQFEFIFSYSLFYLALECSIAAANNPNIVTDGLGPCKIATQAEQGSITVTLPVANQAAFIAITANSQRNTRVKLICTEMTPIAAATIPKLFTVSRIDASSNNKLFHRVCFLIVKQSGEVKGITDTPRTEIGFMQIVVVSRAAASKVTCSWHSYHHYTGLYP